MKKASFTKVRPRSWMTHLGRPLFLVLITCLVASIQSASAQTFTSQVIHPLDVENDHDTTITATFKIAKCEGAKVLYTDDDFNEAGLYFDGSRPLTTPNIGVSGNPNVFRQDTLEICPQDQWHRVSVSFAHFNIAAGDTLWVYQGDTLALNNDAAPFFVAASGNGPSSAYGGWVAADCDPNVNDSGCLTFIFETNGDRSKGTGWEAWITCDDNAIGLTAPDIRSVKLECPTTDDINWAKAWIDFPYPVLNSDCDIANDPDNFILTIRNQSGKICYVSHEKDANGVFQFVGVLPTTPGVLYGIDFAIGIYTAEYQLKADPLKTTGPAVFSVQGPQLTCNDAINVPFGSACMIQIQPDDILENPCMETGIMKYNITIEFGFGKNHKILETSRTKDVLVTGSGASIGTASFPIITRELLKEAGVSVCGGTAEVTIEQVFYEHYTSGITGDTDPLSSYADCHNGIQRTQCTTILNFLDQTPPSVQLRENIDTLVACSELEVDSLIQSFVIDNCSDSLNVTFTVDFDETDGCFSKNGRPDTTTATVVFTAVDDCGNVGTQSHDFIFLRPSKKVHPNIFTVPASLQLQCDGSDDDMERGMPGVKVGFIQNGKFIVTDTMQLSTTDYVCGYILTRTRQDVPATDCGKKEIFTWSAIDWCDSGSGPTEIGSQFVEFTDTIAPSFTGVGAKELEVVLGHFDCTYNAAAFEAPEAIDNCTRPVVTLDQIFRIEDGTKWIVPEEDWFKLDCDSFELRWIAEDACHSQSKTDTANQLVVIKDVTKPSVVTTDELIVSIPNDWGAIINVKDVDAGSYDACGIAIMEIRRDDELEGWGETITVECKDVGTDLIVHLRVTDLKGNSNTAWMIVKGEDRIAPICSDLPTAFLDCSEFHDDIYGSSTDTDGDGNFEDSEWVNLVGPLLSTFRLQFGIFECTDNLTCLQANTNVEEQYQLIPKNCGQVEMRRRFRVVDDGIHNSLSQLNASWVHQTIQVGSNGRWKVTLPADVIGMCNDDITAVIAPIIQNSGCDVIAWEVEDRTFNVPGDACLKIERTYHVINWCKYSPGGERVRMPRQEDFNGNVNEARMVIANDTINSNVGYFTYVQVLKIQDNESPVVTVTNPVDPCINGVEFDALPFGEEDNSPGVGPFECDEEKTWSATATDCSTSESMTWIGRLYDATGNLLKEVNANTLSYVVSNKQTYYAEFWAYDGCGNSGGSVGERMEFWDCKAPIAYLLNGVSISLTADGTIDFWATDVDRGSFDNCSDQSELEFYIYDPLSDVPVPTTFEQVVALGSVISYDCFRVGNQAVTIYVVDEEGNYDFATTTINIQDNIGICRSILGEEEGQGFIAGAIINSDGEEVEEVTVSVNGGTSSVTTDTDGIYRFTLNKGSDYTITPEKNMEPLNGVSTFDLVLISKHILGIETLDSPYKYIAADVNKSGSITAFDMVQLRQLILNIIPEFPNNESWRFVDATYEFSDNPLADDFNEFRSVNNLNADMMGNDFIAIKVGDVNENATPSSLATAETRSSNSTMALQLADRFIEVGQAVNVPVYTNNLTEIQGYQFTLNYDGLELMSVEDGIATTENFNTNIRNALTTSWNKTNLTNTNNNHLFTLNFIAKTSGQLSQLLAISSDFTSTEAYDESGAIMNIALRYNTSSSTIAGYELKQNTPNPFHGETVIGFTLPNAGPATLKVLDVQGKLLKSIEASYQKGYNEIKLNAKELRTTGVLYYQLEATDFVATKKMIVID